MRLPVAARDYNKRDDIRRSIVLRLPQLPSAAVIPTKRRTRGGTHYKFRVESSTQLNCFRSNRRCFCWNKRQFVFQLDVFFYLIWCVAILRPLFALFNQFAYFTWFLFATRNSQFNINFFSRLQSSVKLLPSRYISLSIKLATVWIYWISSGWYLCFAFKV